MKKQKILGSIVVVTYLISEILTEYPDRYTGGALSLFLGLLGFLIVPFGIVYSIILSVRYIKLKRFKKLIIIILFLFPMIDVISGATNQIFDAIKGDVLLVAINYNDFSSHRLMLRENNNIEIFESAMVFTSRFKGKFQQINDSIYTLNLENGNESMNNCDKLIIHGTEIVMIKEEVEIQKYQITKK